MVERTFVDTNVLVYAIDGSDERKQRAARAILDPAASHAIVLSTQVLSEFYVVATRKLGVAGSDARAMVAALSRLPVVSVDPPLVLAAIEASERWQISFWDALILRAAEAAGAARLLSEDLTAGRTYGTVTVENPFAG